MGALDTSGGAGILGDLTSNLPGLPIPISPLSIALDLVALDPVGGLTPVNPITAANEAAARASGAMLTPYSTSNPSGTIQITGTEPGPPTFLGSDLPVDLTTSATTSGGTPVTVATATTPPPVSPGPGLIISESSGPTTGSADITTSSGGTMATTFGDLASQLITTAGNVMVADATGTNPTAPSTTSTLPVYGSTIPTVGTSGVTTTHPSTPGVQYVGLFNTLGQLVGYKAVKRRKRRRQLVSLSDIRGLAELKALLGNGALLREWIATRGFGR